MSSSEPPLNASLRSGNSSLPNGHEPSRFPLGRGFNLSGNGSLGMSANTNEFVPNKDSQERSMQSSTGHSDTNNSTKAQAGSLNPADVNGIAGSVMSNNRGHVYEYKGRKIEIRDVWRDNLEEEMKVIRKVVQDFPYVAMDTEFPGVVARPIGSFHDSTDYSYQTLRCNVDLLKLIQLGVAFADEEGNFADGCPCWQFHFKFSLTDDMYAQDSIDLLVRSGINFQRHEEQGIDVLDFGELLISSGLILCDEVRWISFHGSYDFGYLLKLLTCMPLPPEETAFFDLLKTYFPRLYDVKHMMTKVDGGSFKGGLSKLAEELNTQRIGPTHQAGSDSLLTASIFFEIYKQHFNEKFSQKDIVGVLFGIGQSETELKARASTATNHGSANPFTIPNGASPKMVFYYVSKVPNVGEFKIYMGKDKYENEGLIKHGWPEDIWFHVDNLSSAHVYVRLPRGPIRKKFRETGRLDHVPQLLEQCCQLVKANSIEGCKKSEVDIVYTEWENLRKAAHMADGQVGFVDDKKVIKIRQVPKKKELLKELEKTKTEEYPDLAKERADRDAEVIRIRKQKQREEAKKEKERLRKLREEADRRDLKHLMKDELMVSNDQFKSSEDTSAAVEFEEDFM